MKRFPLFPFLLLAIPSVGAAEHPPALYLSAEEITSIQAKMQTGTEPWRSAYQHWKRQADAALEHTITAWCGGAG